MRRMGHFGLIALAIGGLIFFFRSDLDGVVQQMKAQYIPCAAPIRYSIGALDKRFDMTRERFLARIEAAEKIWEDAAGRELFSYDEKGPMEIYLKYDERQATTKALQELDGQVDESLSSYNAVKERYENLRASYLEKSAALDSRIAAYETREETYTRDVRRWNAKGGAPSGEYERLNNEKEALAQESTSLRAAEHDINEDVKQINSLVETLNHLASVLNLQVSQYNSVGRTNAEFEEGAYLESLGSQKIEIYEFSSEDKLVRVLAHELGHALGLDHVSDERAIMYEVNAGDSLRAAPADIAALKERCHLP